MVCSKMDVTFATSIKIMHKIPIQKVIFGVHVMATKLRSSSP
jgi:hypothetical protein